MNNITEGKKYSRIEASNYLGISVVTLDRVIAKRKISFFKVGRRIILDKRHLDDFLSEREHKALSGNQP